MVPRLPPTVDCLIMGSALLTKYTSVMDGRTDRQTRLGINTALCVECHAVKFVNVYEFRITHTILSFQITEMAFRSSAVSPLDN